LKTTTKNDMFLDVYHMNKFLPASKDMEKLISKSMLQLKTTEKRGSGYNDMLNCI